MGSPSGRREIGVACSILEGTLSNEHARASLPDRLAKEVQYQIQGLARVDLGAYTYEHSKSQYKDAKMDFSVFDPSGKLVLLGRGFSDRDFFWSPTADPRLVSA
jgi:hypothetical protein